MKDVHELSEIVLKDPQVAYSLYINGISLRWRFLARTTLGILEAFKPLLKAIRTMFLPSLFGGWALSDQFRNIIALPTRYGGLGIYDPSQEADMRTPNWQQQTSHRQSLTNYQAMKRTRRLRLQ